MDLGNWFEDEAATVDSTTLANFEKMIEDYLAVHAEKDAFEVQVTNTNKVLQKMEAKLRTYFEAQGLTSFKTRAGNLILNERVMYKAPEGEGREECLEKLRESGQIDSVMGFNAGKFSSWYKEQVQAEGEFSLPGVKEERLIYMSFRKA
jgi:hypothetical protein